MKKIILLLSILFWAHHSWPSSLKLELVSLNNFTPEEETRIRRVVGEVEVILNSIDFKNSVLDHEFKNKKIFHDNLGKSNQEIYLSIMEGNEKLSSSPDHKWQLDYKLGSLGKNVLAQTSPSIKTVTINQARFPSFLDSNFAGTICHEQMHKLGYGHDYRNNPERPFSVPYGVGSICTNLYRKLIRNDEGKKIIPYCGFWCKLKGVFSR